MKNLLTKLGFQPKEGENNLWHKLYSQHNNCSITVDFNQQKINYAELIKAGNKTTQNFSQDENWVVLECVNRLLEKGYSPQNIILEKTYPAGHGHSARLDICVNNNDGQEYLLIECKTYGKEFNKELSNTKKDGGQLFSYFKFENKASIIMLYASKLDNQEIIFQNEIIKIEDNYRTGSAKDFYERWNKITKDNGVFDDWVKPYDFVSKALNSEDLVEIREEDSSTIFNHFLEILRHNVASDKGNAFNKIFTLFLCKVYDEKSTKTGDELKFQWLEGKDTDIDFQLRLTDLYKKGMKDFLEKEVTDFSDAEFDQQYKNLDDKTKKSLKQTFAKLRLEKNNEFAIKEVFDNQSFRENAKIVKEVVELLQKYQIRYNKRQQYLSDFFELLLTTGLKQESGQFFTPVPIAQFIIKSLPLDGLVDKKLEDGKKDELMPFVMDYAAGSGHFLTESMHEMQRLLDAKNPDDYIQATAKKIRNWKDDHFDWAEKYVYGVEKDYRLVKVGKVGCYLHGDGLANVLLSDGLASFKHPEYRELLSKKDEKFPQENKQFDVVVSNPPYSVSSFKNASADYYQQKDFELYASLTDSSSEIECLFVERTKQLLKDGGMAGVILPSSILSNTGVYTKTREIILKYFEIIAITELGSNTFMATGTNTVVLFLRRRNNYDSIHLKTTIDKFFENLQELTLGGIENPISKYLAYAWEGINFEDYKTLLQKIPNKTIEQHELYQDYQTIKAKNSQEKWQKILELEQQKLFYFVLTYPQKIVLIKTGEKKAEKQFLGYEFSNRRGSEGIHPIQRGKSIEQCTQLFDPNIFDNPQKASTYVYQAFKGDSSEIDENLKGNISRVNLVDLISFDRVDFEKTISLSVKKKLKIESQWGVKKIGETIFEQPKSKIKVGTAKDVVNGVYPFFTSGEKALTFNDFLLDNENIYLSTGGNAIIKYFNGRASYSTDTFAIKSLNEKELKTKFIFHLLDSVIVSINQFYFKGLGLRHLQKPDFRNIKIPIPPKEIQQKIINEIEDLEKKEDEATTSISNLQNNINDIVGEINTNNLIKLKQLMLIVRGASPRPIRQYQTNDKNGVNWIKIGDVKPNSKYITKTKEKITLDGAKKSRFVDIGDFILSNSMSFGRPYIMKITGFIHDGWLLMSHFSKELNKDYLYYILSSNLVQEQFKNAASGGTTVDNLNITKVENTDIPLITLLEQQKIVAKIAKIEAKINKLEAQTNAIPQQKEAVLKRYL